MDWINSFILNDALVCNTEFQYLQTKACCEYILYCSQLKQRNLIKKQNIEILNSIRNNENIEYFNPLLSLCLSTEEVDSSIPKSESIEHNYITSIITNYQDYTYWNNMTSRFLGKFSTKGMNVSSIYELTHIVFYSTNFGLNNFIKQQDRKIISALIDITLLCIDKCRDDKNWDLIRELYLTLLILDIKYITFIIDNVEIENKTIKSKQGWTLSNGDNLQYFEEEIERLSFKQKYSLYHTTLICKLLETFIKTTHNSGFAQRGH